MNEETLRKQFPQFKHCVAVKKSDIDDLKMIVRISRYLQDYCKARILREYRSYSENGYHYYWFIEQEPATKLQSWKDHENIQ